MNVVVEHDVITCGQDSQGQANALVTTVYSPRLSDQLIVYTHDMQIQTGWMSLSLGLYTEGNASSAKKYTRHKE